jgi:hypothetical protein
MSADNKRILPYFRRVKIMKKNICFLGLLICVFAFATLVASCKTEEEPDVWSPVTSLSQLNGTWKGSVTQTQTMQEYLGMTDEELATSGVAFGDTAIAMTIDITMTINASAKTTSGTMKMTMAFSGSNIAVIWITISTLLGSTPGIQVDNTNHSLTMTENISETLDDDEIAQMLASIQINQNGTKIKSSAPTGEEGSSPVEIILIKQ